VGASPGASELRLGAAAGGYARTLDCVHCGFCLPACPTYRAWGTEADSPRGRITLVRAVAEGRLEPSGSLRRHIDRCLGCRGCESVCPAGVRFGEMLEHARHDMRPAGPPPFAFRALLSHPRRLRAAFTLVQLAQVSGLAKAARALGLSRRLLGRAVAELERDLPRVPPARLRASLPRRTPAAGRARGRVAVLEGCVARQLFGAVNRATARVLAACGFDVVVPERHACCGALHAHQGYLEQARDLARHTIEAFERADAEAVVVNSAGCGSAMKEYGSLLAADAAWAGRAAAFARRVRDVSEFLAPLDLPAMPRRVERRVAYHDACHLAHAQRIVREPRDLLSRVPGIELVPLPDAEQCCGSAGIYNVVEYDASMEILEAKIDCIASSGADVVAAGNPGCLLQIAVGSRRRGLSIEVRHPVELLDAALAGGER
jgi:glycolate oxidase iron-sulfur subunit